MNGTLRMRLLLKVQIRKAVLIRDKYTCAVCNTRKPDSELEAHHVKPKWKGGSYLPQNLVAVDLTCHDRIQPPESYWK